MTFIYKNYSFTVEPEKGNNVVLEKIRNTENGTVLEAMLEFFLWCLDNGIQYITIEDIKGRDRYSTVIKYMFENAPISKKMLLSKSFFINDGPVLRVKLY